MSETIRTFIAVPLSDEIRQALARIQDQLKSHDVDVKWVRPENIHLTLKFLGDVKTKKIGAIKDMLDRQLSRIPSFRMLFNTLGAFPDIERPRVIWIGIEDADGRIRELAQRLETECAQLGFKKEDRPFSPHITIGRTRSPRNIVLLSQAVAQLQLPENLIQKETEIVLYKSTLTPKGPIYEPLKQIDLVRTSNVP